MPPLISVIIPNYNHAAFLSQRIETVLRQSFSDFEIILLDDCSTDESIEIIERYRNQRQVTHVVVNDRNGGSTFSQWKKGLELAQGELVWLAESDDFADISFLQTAVQNFDAVPNLHIFFSNSARVDEGSNEVGNFNGYFVKTPLLDFSKDFTITGEDFVNKGLRIINVVINASAVVFRKAAVSDFFQIHYHKFRYCGDWYFWAQIAHGGMVSYNASKLNYFRFHSQTTRAAKPVWQQIDYYLEIVLVQILIARKYNIKEDDEIIYKYVEDILRIMPPNDIWHLFTKAIKIIPSLTPFLVKRYFIYQTLKKIGRKK